MTTTTVARLLVCLLVSVTIELGYFAFELLFSLNIRRGVGKINRACVRTTHIDATIDVSQYCSSLNISTLESNIVVTSKKCEIDFFDRCSDSV